MYLNIKPALQPTSLAKQAGSSLIVAVFLVVVFAILSLGITQTISSSNDQSINEILGTRALLAADSGNEFVLQQLFPINSNVSNCQASQQLYFNVDGLLHCNVVMQCSEETILNSSYFQVVSTGVCKAGLQGSNSNKLILDATCLANEVCVSRTIEVEAKKHE